MTHRRLFPIATLASLVLVLAACEITVSPTPTPTWPPAFAGTLVAQATFSPTDQARGTLAPGTTRYYELNVNTVRDLVYAEVQGQSGLRVSIFTLGGTRLAVSESATYFGPTIASLSTSADAVGPSSISTQFVCLGPCVAVPTASSFVVAVSNPTDLSRTFEVYAYTFDATDQNEPNDTVGGATPLDGAGSYLGAIERLGDADYFVYNATAGGSFFVVFDPFDPALGLELEILDCTECVVLDGSDGFQVEGLLDGDVLRVRSAAGRAGPSATSGYSLQVTASPPGSSVSSR